MPQTRDMNTNTAAHDANLDRFYADMTDALMLDTLDHMDTVERESESLVDPAFAGMCWTEIVETLDEHARESDLEALTRYWLSR